MSQPFANLFTHVILSTKEHASGRDFFRPLRGSGGLAGRSSSMACAMGEIGGQGNRGKIGDRRNVYQVVLWQEERLLDGGRFSDKKTTETFRLSPVSRPLFSCFPGSVFSR